MLALALAQTQASGVSAPNELVGVLGLVAAVLAIVGCWKVFTKAGRPGWISIIPIWNTIVLLQITGRSGWWVVGYLLPLLNMLNIFIQVRWCIEMAQSYRRGVGFAIGPFFLEPLFLILLAFDGSRYVGPAARGRFVVPATA